MPVTIGNTNFSNAYASSWSFTLNNNGLGVVVAVMMDTGNAVSGLPQVDGEAMTLGKYLNNGNRKAWLYYIDDVPSGDVVCAGNLTGSSYRYVWAASMVNSMPGDSKGNDGSGGGVGTSRNVAVVTSPDSILVAAMCLDNNPGAITPGSGTTEYVDANIAGTTNKAWVGTEPGDGGSVTIGASWPASVSHAMVVIEILVALIPPAKMRNYRRARSAGPVTVYE